MGNPVLLQACLRLETATLPSPLEVGVEYAFEKEGHRLYQLEVPMDLRAEDWQALGRCVVTEYTVGHNKTKGTYVMVQIFDEAQSKQVSATYVSDEKVREILQKVLKPRRI